MLSLMKSLPEILIEKVPTAFCWRTFLFIWIERFNFLSLNFEITQSLFFSRWHACKSSGVTSCPVMEVAQHTVSSRTLSPMSRSTGLTSRDPLRWYWALLAAFRSNWLFVGAEEYYSSLLLTLQFFDIDTSYFNSSCLAAKI